VDAGDLSDQHLACVVATTVTADLLGAAGFAKEFPAAIEGRRHRHQADLIMHVQFGHGESALRGVTNHIYCP